MKKTFNFVLVLFILLTALNAFAEADNGMAFYQQIMNSDSISLADACAMIGTENDAYKEIRDLQEMLNALRACEGRFVQLPDEDGSGKIYTADVSFYLAKGMPYCSVEYTNYGGTISDGAVEISAKEEYLFAAHSTGEFFSNGTEFIFEFAPDRLHVQWADGLCEYLLVRGTEEQLASANKEPPFVETDAYKTLVQTLDRMFDGMNHFYHYEENGKIFTVYLECGSGYKNTLSDHAAEVRDKWQEILESVLPISTSMDDALTLATRKGLADYTQAQFAIVFVEEVNQNNMYCEDDYLAVVTDGEITYNMVDEILNGKSSASGCTASKPTTIGEGNALRQAKLYLEVMPFSFEGLVEQLEYEGYSYSEAVFGAANSGANWYEQAAKAAGNYLELMPFSRSALVEQLEYDGYTHDQAVYGVEENGY